MEGGQISTWQDAELCVAAWMRLMGHTDAQPTLSHADGLDIVSQTAIAQVRWRVAEASVLELRQFFEAVTSPQADLYHFSRAGYADGAVEWASEVGMATFRLGPDRAIEPLNEPARIALQSVRTGAVPRWSAPGQHPAYESYPGALPRSTPAPAAPPMAPPPPAAAPISYPPPPPAAAPISYPPPPPPVYQVVVPAAPPKPPKPPGTGLRRWGIGLMIFGFLGALSIVSALVGGRGAPALSSFLSTMVFYVGLGILGFGLYRAGRLKRDRP